MTGTTELIADIRDLSRPLARDVSRHERVLSSACDADAAADRGGRRHRRCVPCTTRSVPEEAEYETERSGY